MQIWTGSITDDSGFLGLINPATYGSFVDEDWNLDQLFQHFKDEMSKQNLLIWATGLEADWRVIVNLDDSNRPGFRETPGAIEVTNSGICLINYESLTMGAQFEDIKLPEAHLDYCHFELAPGNYTCRIIQMFDPVTEESAQGESDFVIQLSKEDEQPMSWMNIPWYETP